MKKRIKSKVMWWLEYPYDIPTQQEILKKFQPNSKPKNWLSFGDSQFDLFGTIVCENPIVYCLLCFRKLFALEFLLHKLPPRSGTEHFFVNANSSRDWTYNPAYFFLRAEFLNKIDLSLMLFLVRNEFILKTEEWLDEPANAEAAPLKHCHILNQTSLIERAKRHSKQIDAVEIETDPGCYQGGGWLSLAKAHFEAGKVWLGERYAKLSLPEERYEMDVVCEDFEEYCVAHAHSHLARASALYERLFGNMEPKMCKYPKELKKTDLINEAFKVMQLTERCRDKLGYYNDATNLDRYDGYKEEAFYLYLKQGEAEDFKFNPDSLFQRFLSKDYNAEMLQLQAKSSNHQSLCPTIESPKLSPTLSPMLDERDINLGLVQNKEQNTKSNAGFFSNYLDGEKAPSNTLRRRPGQTTTAGEI
jgi:hypothetical protein